MALAHMISIDKDALICDLAETYHIYDYRSLPLKAVATFSCGLRDDSRIKMRLSQSNLTADQMLLACIADNTRMTAWLQSSDAVSGNNRPPSLFKILTGGTDSPKPKNGVVGFDSGEAFEAEWNRLTKKESE